MQNIPQPFDREQIKRDFNRAAYRYDMHALLQRQVADRLFSYMHAAPLLNDRVLDAGCGTGYFHELARKHGYLWNITQLDIAYSMCEIAASYASPPTYGGTYTVNADLVNTPFNHHSFGCIFSSLTVQWALSLPDVLNECYRILSPGGMLYISTLLPGTLTELEQSFVANGFHSPISPFLPLDTITAHMQEAGFHTDIHTDAITIDYYSVLQLMRSLKAIGARNKSAPPQAKYLGKHGLDMLQRYYQEHFADSTKLPATWKVAYLIARK